MEDSYTFDDSYAFDETDTDSWSSPADDSAREHLETQDESPSKERSKLSLAQKLWFALRSLASWKEKARAKQEKIRSLEQIIRNLLPSRENWKERAIQAEKQLKAHTASADQAGQTKISSKQTIISSRE